VGKWVKYDDHVAALAGAYDAGWTEALVRFEDGWRSAINECVDAVERLAGKPGAHAEHYLAAFRELLPEDGRVSAPRTLTADDPEPAVGSVVLDGAGCAWQRHADGWYVVKHSGPESWRYVLGRRWCGPLRLLHDGGAGMSAVGWTGDDQLARMYEIVKAHVYLAPDTPTPEMALALNEIQRVLCADERQQARQRVERLIEGRRRINEYTSEPRQVAHNTYIDAIRDAAAAAAAAGGDA
jgi:hypothetical protein